MAQNTSLDTVQEQLISITKSLASGSLYFEGDREVAGNKQSKSVEHIISYYFKARKENQRGRLECVGGGCSIRIDKQGWLKGWHLSEDGKQVSKSEGILGEAISDNSSSKE